MNIVFSFFHWLNVKCIKRVYDHVENRYIREKLGGYDSTSSIVNPEVLSCPHKVFLSEKSTIYSGAVFIMNPDSEKGRFILGRYSAAAQGLTVITDNHSSHPVIGHYYQQDSLTHELDSDLDVIVKEDVWIGANVTILPGVEIGRGSIISAGTLLRKTVPPYAIVIGNPGRVVGFKFTPEEVIEHEKALYKEDERIPVEVLEKNYEKYFLKRINVIKDYLN